ncbi:RagB/SusD family nutrient uptake outer membrane protein [Flavobacteriaceae bacterium F08102]|nr:RagB/SusD family nutrient uptake outer membrane protein [Flavobacteriaceae bacterium F08102]
MNKLINIIGMFFILTLISCDVDEVPPHSLVENNVITSQSTAESALIGAFVPFKTINPAPFASGYVSNGSHMIGFTTGTFSGFDTDCEENNFTSSIGWDQCSDMINAANIVIEKTAQVADSEFADNRKKEIIAEATFLRFFAQYYLFRHFAQHWDINSPYGGLMRREPTRLSSVDYARSTVAESYTLLLEDLDYIIANGPEFSSVYRPSKLLAKAFKAEVLLMRGSDADLQNAITIANEVLNDPTRSMESSYNAIFENGYDSSELLFTRFFDDQLANIVFRNVDSMVNSFGGRFEVTEELVEILGDDSRASMYIDEIDETTRVPKIYKESGECLPYYMRTSEMYLIIAEANARLGLKSDAIDAINVLRSRAGEDDLDPSDIADDDLITVLFNEISKEIALEKGYAWFASIRLIGPDGKRLVYSLKPTVLNSNGTNQFIWPIPNEEVTLNRLMVQNPGYEQL